MTKISVVILTKNSQKHIEKCLKSVISQNYPDFEIIVIDALSKDNTVEIFHKFFIKQIKLITVPENTSIGKARQIGVDNSQGEIIAFIDSDVELPYNEWFIDMMQPLECGYGTGEFYPKEMIAGTTTLAKCHEDNSDPWILKHLHNSFEYKNRVIGLRSLEIVGTGHCLIRKKCIKEVGGFKDVNSSEDLNLTRRIIDTNLVFIYLPAQKVYHYHVDGIMHYIKKHLIRNKINAIRRLLFEGN